MTGFKGFIAGLMMLALGACATAGGTGKVPLGPLGQRITNAIVDVSPENQDLKVCWLAAGAVEVMTDLAQRAGGSAAMRTLGHLFLLQAAIDKAHISNSFWIETDAADVALLFAGVLKDVGKNRLARILLSGPIVSNFLNVAKRTVILTVKGHAVIQDMNRVLQGVEDGEISKFSAWTACQDRMSLNRNTLWALIGWPGSASVEGHRDSPMAMEGYGGSPMALEEWLYIDMAEYAIITGTETVGTQTEIGEYDFIGPMDGDIGSTETMLSDWSVGPQGGSNGAADGVGLWGRPIA